MISPCLFALANKGYSLRKTSKLYRLNTSSIFSEVFPVSLFASKTGAQKTLPSRTRHHISAILTRFIRLHFGTSQTRQSHVSGILCLCDFSDGKWASQKTFSLKCFGNTKKIQHTLPFKGNPSYHPQNAVYKTSSPIDFPTCHPTENTKLSCEKLWPCPTNSWGNLDVTNFAPQRPCTKGMKDQLLILHVWSNLKADSPKRFGAK